MLNSPHIALEGHAQDAAFFSRENTHMKSSSAASSRGNEITGNSPAKLQSEKPPADAEDRHQVEKLKSPRPEKSFRADWQVLIDEALGDEIADFDDDLD